MSLPTRSRHATSARARVPLIRLLRLLIPLLAVFACLEVSGTLAFASEIGVVADAASDDCCSDCPLEKDGKECPPMCPVCHCTHAVLAVPAALVAQILADPPPTGSLVFARQRRFAPPTPPLGALYRPPQFATVLR